MDLKTKKEVSALFTDNFIDRINEDVYANKVVEAMMHGAAPYTLIEDLVGVINDQGFRNKELQELYERVCERLAKLKKADFIEVNDPQEIN